MLLHPTNIEQNFFLVSLESYCERPLDYFDSKISILLQNYCRESFLQLKQQHTLFLYSISLLIFKNLR